MSGVQGRPAAAHRQRCLALGAGLGAHLHRGRQRTGVGTEGPAPALRRRLGLSEDGLRDRQTAEACALCHPEAHISQWNGIHDPSFHPEKFPEYSELLGVKRPHKQKYKMFCFYYMSKIGWTHSCRHWIQQF